MPDGTTVVLNEAPALPAGPTIENLIGQYVKLRDKVDEVKKRHTQELEPYGQVMSQLEGVLMQALISAGVSSMKSKAGTIYKSTATSVSVKDWPATLAHIQTNKLWDLLEARVSKTAAQTIIEETGQPIPGVNLSQSESLRVRRS